MVGRISYDPSDRMIPFSRSALEDYLRCARCFYLHRRLGIVAPPGPGSGLSVIVGTLLKKEFDRYRAAQEPHPIMAGLPGDLVPFAHPDLDGWRKPSLGVRVPHRASGFEVFGALHDVWLDRKDGALRVVDIETTYLEEVPPLSRDLYRRRQIEICQWLLRQRGFKVSPTAYRLLQRVNPTATSFEGQLRFNESVVSVVGDADWVAGLLIMARFCLDADTAPDGSEDCKTCTYVALASAS